jgi:hypothetical protein
MLTAFLGYSWTAREYKQHLEKILFVKEMGLMPEAQLEAERRIALRKLEAKKSEILQRHRAELRAINAEIKEIENTTPDSNKAKLFVRRCPKEGCNGFLSTQLKCGICEIWACADCREVKGTDKNAEHKCDPEVVANIDAIESDSKSCPKCAMAIFKIDGCDQMWCPICQTAFSWKTGRIEVGRIHNPHYNEYIRKMGIPDRTPGEIQCGREIDEYFIRQTRYWNDQYADIAIAMLHVQHKQRKLTQVMNNGTFELRVKYVMGEITENEFKYKVQRDDKKREKCRMEVNILTTFIHCMTDLLYRVMDNYKEADAIFKEMEALRLYTNRCFWDIASSYQNTALNIDGEFRI